MLFQLFRSIYLFAENAQIWKETLTYRRERFNFSALKIVCHGCSMSPHRPDVQRKSTSKLCRNDNSVSTPIKHVYKLHSGIFAHTPAIPTAEGTLRLRG